MPAADRDPRRDRVGHLFLIAGGTAFFASGPLHPTGSDEGDKTEQLHSMLVDSAWYPAHLVGLLGFACVAAGLLALARDPALRDRLGRLLPISVAVAVVDWRLTLLSGLLFSTSCLRTTTIYLACR